VSENEVRELNYKLDEMRGDITELSKQVAGLTATVNLLVRGKIKTEDNTKESGMTKITMAALEIVRLIAAGLVGFFAGKS
jgi:hypothetical protein